MEQSGTIRNMITREETEIQTELIRERLKKLGAKYEPLSHTEARLVISTMVYGGELSADWFLMTNSSLQLFEQEGLVK